MRIKLVMPLGQAQERWQTDRQVFLARAKFLGAEASLQMTSFVLATKNQQAEQSLIEGVDVLVIISPLTVNPAPLVDMAHKAGVQVVAYDRLITDCPLDLYVSFDNVKVGEMQARYLVVRKPQGNYLLIRGPAGDTNTSFFHRGQMNVLKPGLERGEIKIVADEEAKDWRPGEAYRITEEALEKAKGQIDVVLAMNDGLADGAIQAMAEKGLAGKVLVSGQDAELQACKRIVKGTQTMTVYKPIKLLATTAADAAVALAKKEPLPGKAISFLNGRQQVPALLLTPTLVDKENLETTVVVDGFQKKEDIF